MEFKISGNKGYTPQIGQLVSMMDYARKTTIDAVQGLGVAELDYLLTKESNSIGALLLHIAAIEKGFQIEIFDDRKPNQQEMDEWGAAYSLGEQGRRQIDGNSLDYYIRKLAEVRKRTLIELQQRTDDWLYKERLWDGHPSNNYFI